MSLVHVELCVAAGLADTFSLNAVHYGLIYHLRQSAGTRTRELFLYRPFRAEGGDLNELPGVCEDRERMEQERGSESELDQRLVRKSAVAVDLESLRAPAAGVLQRVFLLLRPQAGEPLSWRLGLTLALRRPEPTDIACVNAGPALQLLWSAADWRDDRTAAAIAFNGDMARYIRDLDDQANRLIAAQDETIDDVARLQDVPAPPLRRRPPRVPAAAAVTVPAASIDPPRAPELPGLPPAAEPQASTSSLALGIVFAICAGLALLSWMIVQPSRPDALPPDARGADAALPAAAGGQATGSLRRVPPASLAPGKTDAIVVPTGGVTASLDELYAFRRADHDRTIRELFDSARMNNRADFAVRTQWLRGHVPIVRAGSEATVGKRRSFDAQISSLLAVARQQNDKKQLWRAVALLERFLQSNFEYAPGHANLALALASLDEGAAALPAAFQAIALAPDAPDSYLAAGIALARSGDQQVAIDAFCVALRVGGFAPDLIAEINRIKRGEDFNFPTVHSAMRDTERRCPRSRWAN